MPELPEVETVRRMLERTVLGRPIASATLSGKRLRHVVARDLPRRLAGRAFRGARRTGKYLLLDLDGDLVLLSHLGMSGRWLFQAGVPAGETPHVHARIVFRDGSTLCFQDPRRFGMLKLLTAAGVAREPALRILGPDPLVSPPAGLDLHARTRGLRTSVKTFLMDQRRIAGIGNIYASEILFLAGVDPRRPVRAVGARDWEAISQAIPEVLNAAVERMGTTFSAYRTLWNEPGSYGEQLMVYDRATEPCRRCGSPIRRIVQAQRSTFYCPSCQKRRSARPGRAANERVTSK